MTAIFKAQERLHIYRYAQCRLLAIGISAKQEIRPTLSPAFLVYGAYPALRC